MPVEVKVPDQLPSEYYGKYVFNRTQMSKYLSKETMNTVLEAIDRGTTLHRGIAEHVAAGMKMGHRNGCLALHALVSTFNRRDG